MVELVNSIWPSKDKTVSDLVRGFPDAQRHYLVSYSGTTIPSLRHLVWDDGALVAHALTFERPIECEGTPLSVMALSGVCVSPTHRGAGLGRKVTRDAFQRVDSAEFAVSLFQTTIPSFYERLGGIVVTNQFRDSRNEDDPEANPWGDEWVMIYPRTYPWPGGLIDLNGPGY